MDSREEIAVDPARQQQLDPEKVSLYKVPTWLDLKSLSQSDDKGLGDHLQPLGVSEDTCKTLQEKQYTGDRLLKLRLPQLKQLITDYGDRCRLIQIITRYLILGKSKIFFDPVHGEFKMHPLLTLIIDTPELQRLRDIRQLGGAHKVYCGASHSRFEHSLGVSHLAGKLGRTIQQHQPEYMSDKDILCLEIAGLCHELGQGPFSRLFVQSVVPYVTRSQSLSRSFNGQQVTTASDSRPDAAQPTQNNPQSGNIFKASKTHGSPLQENINWVPAVSVEIFCILAERLKEDFELHGINENEVGFIKLLINPLKDEQKQLNMLEKLFKGYGNRLYLFQILSNHRSEIDVNRFDYLARDSYYTGLKTGFDHQRLLMHMRIEKDDGKLVIGFRDKVAPNVYDLFQTRYQLYRSVYMHKPTMVIELMIADAFKKASEHNIFSEQETPNQESQSIGEGREAVPDRWSIADVIIEVRKIINNDAIEGKLRWKSKKVTFEKYLKLSDYLYHRILHATEGFLLPATRILKRLETRNLYTLIGKTKPTEESEFKWDKDTVDRNLSIAEKEKRIKEKILTEVKDSSERAELTANDTLIVKIVSVGYGVTSVHPSYGATYYPKDNIQMKNFLVPEPPNDFKSRKHMHIRVFFAGEKDNLPESARKAFKSYCEKLDLRYMTIPKCHQPDAISAAPTMANDSYHLSMAEAK